MSSVIGAIVTLLVGIATLFATFTGTYMNYVKAGLRWPLILAGLILVGLGGSTLVYRLRERGPGHGHVESIGILLLVFVAALVMAPPPLGADAIGDRSPNRIGAEQVLPSLDTQVQLLAADDEEPPVGESTTTSTLASPSSTSSTLASPSTTAPETVDRTPVENAPLESPAPADMEQSTGGSDDGSTTSGSVEDEVYEITMYDLIGYAYFYPEEILEVPLQVVGFAAPETYLDEGFRLTIYMMSCCAADAYPLQVALVGAPSIPPNDQWLIADVVWNGDMIEPDDFGEGVPVLEVLGLELIDPPSNPYGY